ncbi:MULTISPECIES: DUF2268 domain-containing protein [Exiguobacterium]|uniref:DUF2268 domain-containing protein n=1 Tax=Exiguobacterium TaxID=33986 RepID=UPI0004799178|nr:MULTISPECIES: DUF2268 domain-containing putative Zn-dependent protease [Exiguobacterium]MCT4780458.1 DUF2268 domain-containing protein [Exiguobacterium soli]
MTFKQDNQTITVIPLYDAYQSYVDAALKKPTENGALFEKYVLAENERVRKQEKVSEQSGVYNPLDQPTNNLKYLKESVTYLKKHETRINKQIKKSLQRSIKELPRQNDLVVLVAPISPDDPSHNKKMEGVSGIALSKDLFVLYLDVDFAEPMLAYTTAHEYHHTVVAEQLSTSSVTDNIVTEGKADLFAKDLYPDVNPLWTQPLVAHSLKHVLHEVNAYNIKYSDLQNGNYELQIPSWSNYAIGNTIMTEFIQKNPDVPVTKWTHMPTADVLQKSGYAKKLTAQ